MEITYKKHNTTYCETICYLGTVTQVRALQISFKRTEKDDKIDSSRKIKAFSGNSEQE